MKDDKRTDLNIGRFVPAMLLFVLFLIFTLIVRLVDVSPIGPEGSSVGLSWLNGAFAGTFGFNEAFYDLSKYLGYASLGVAACFALLGLVQLIRGKSIRKVDPAILMLGGFYVVVIVFYALFEVLIINYRPVILDEGLEASYPSTHTMLAICVAVSGLILAGRYIGNGVRLTAFRCFLIVIMAAVVIFRLLSGVHWLTDIVGSLLLSSALCLAFKELVGRLPERAS